MRAPATFPDEPEPDPWSLAELGIQVVITDALPQFRALVLSQPTPPDVFDPARHAMVITGIQP